MPGLKINVKSTRFLDELQKRRNSFSKRTVSGVLTVPPEMKWWMWLEFGTHGPYPIEPHHPPEALRWFDPSGNAVVRERVMHPGIRPRAFVRKALPTIASLTIRDVYAAFLE